MRVNRLPLVGALLVAACLPAARPKPPTKKVAKARAEQVPTGAVEFPTAPPPPFTPHPGKTGNTSLDRFVALWNDLHDPAKGYFSAEGIPYHAVETLIVEAPDYGHLTTSEAYSYWLWLEAAYGRLTKDWAPLGHAWKNLETYAIPTDADQPTAGSYNDTHPAVFAPEHDTPQGYPSRLDNAAPIGADPIARELRETYGTPSVYGMHWILDVDNWYGFGRRGDRVSRPSYMNTFQRGMQESVWETVPQPSWDDFQYGGPNGFLDLFVRQDGGYARQWKYTNAPDADARAVQAIYWAKRWADEQGGARQVDGLVTKAARLGDYLRYAFFDKYFKAQGCRTPSCPAGQNDKDEYGGAHHLLSWYYAWGGSLTKDAGWSWRIGSSSVHSGYQNPLAAHVLGHVGAFKPQSPNGARDWGKSLDRQLQLLRWVQSNDGGLAGGATNSWRGRYAQPPAGTPTFHGLAYDEAPVYADPPSNSWFGFQAWGVDRLAQLFYVTGDSRAKVILDRWASWVLANTHLTKDGGYEIPSTLVWSGHPAANWDDTHQHWNPRDSAYNRTLRVKVKDHTQDVGVAGALARTLLFYAKRAGRDECARLARELLERSWTKYRTDKGVSNPEPRGDYKRFADEVFIPEGFRGRMPSGAALDAHTTFASLRPQYKQDPAWPQVAAYIDGGPAPVFRYHRFWAQVDLALAHATLGWLYPDGISTPGRKSLPARPKRVAAK